jgi:Tfp pilus assembly protein PilF
MISTAGIRLAEAPRRWVPALAVLVFLVYGQTLSHGFHFDDDNTIVHNASIQEPVEWGKIWSDPGAFSRTPGAGMYRPLLLTSYVGNFAWSGLQGWSWHLANILLHAVVSVLTVLMAVKLGCGKTESLLAGVIFALHPLAVEPVSYVSSRSESLATAFLLLCVLFHIRSRQAGGAPRHLLLSTGSLAAGLLCKATAVTAPLLIGAYEILILKSKPRVVLQRLLPSLALVAAYVIFVRGLLSEALLAAPVRDMASQLATQAKAFSYYARLVVLPHPLAVEHPFSSSTWLQLEPWLGLACLLSVLGLVLAVGLRRLRFLLLWPMLVLLPTTVIPLNVLVSEHRLYPAMAGLACAGALLLSHWRQMRSPVPVFAMVLLLLSFGRGAVWASERSLWEDAARWSTSPRPHVRLALVERAEGNLVAAQTHLRTALRLQPDHAPAWNNLGNVQRQQGQPAAAQISYEKALELLPSYPEALTNLAALRVQQGRLEDGLALYERALSLHPEHKQIHNNLGTLLLQLEQPVGAERHLRRALELGGGAPIWFNLSGALEGQGRTTEATDALHRAVQIDSSYARAWLHLGNLHLSAGKSEDAADAWRRFLRHWQGDKEIAERVQRLLDRHQL